MAINREQLSEMLSAYLDNEIDPRERAIVQEAIRSDPAARRLLEELRQTSAAVAALPRHPAPPGLSADIDAHLERSQLVGRPSSPSLALHGRGVRWASILATAATLVVAAGAGWWYFRPDLSGPKALDSAFTRRDEAAPMPGESPARIAEAPVRTVLNAEMQIAAGADPGVLKEHPFDVEPVRMRVTARDAADRDALARQFADQLAVVSAENIATRSATRAAKMQPAGSFYLVGKPGVNYDDPGEKQILVRVPKSQAETLMDSLTRGPSSAKAGQLALQAGPLLVEGETKTRELLQVIASPAVEPVVDAKTEAERVDFERSRGTPPERPLASLMDTLMDMAGIRAVAPSPVPRNAAREFGEDSARTRVQADGGDEADSLADAAAAPKEAVKSSKAVEPPATPGALVARRSGELERSRRTPDAAGAAAMQDRNERTTTHRTELAGAASKDEAYITLVVEFEVPSAPAPTPPRPIVAPPAEKPTRMETPK